MINDFDMASHIFAALPIALTYFYNLTYLFVFAIFTVFVSLAHHAYSENEILTHVDEFFASSLIFISFLVYVETLTFAGAAVFFLRSSSF